MDHHALMWDEATRDLATERHEAALMHTLADLSGVRDFTHNAADATEYGHRIALAAEAIAKVASVHDIDPRAVHDALDTSFWHVLAARTAHQTKTAAAAPPPQRPAEPAAGPPPGTPADTGAQPEAGTTATTSKPRTLPAGAPAAVPLPAPITPGVAPAPAAMSNTAAQRTASRRQIIEDDIAALNPQLPRSTIERLATRALRHLAAEPLAYGNWDNSADGPITRDIKEWEPGSHGDRPEGGAPGAGLSPSGPDTPTPAAPAAAALVPRIVEDLSAAAAAHR